MQQYTSDEARRSQQRQAVLTALTLFFVVASWLGERLGVPEWGILGCNIGAYLAGSVYALKNTYESLRAWRLDVDFLMLLAALGAAAIDYWHEGATLLFLFALSNTLQDYAMDRSRRAIGSLFKGHPTTANVVRDGEEREVPLAELRIGDRVIVRPGEMTPADGRIEAGESDLNEASITGESTPVDKRPGQQVFAGSINGAGSLEITVTHRAEDSTLARIVKMVESAQEQKARTQRFLDDVERYYVLIVVGGVLGFIFVPWLGFGHEFKPTFYQAMVLLVVASPCALIISAPAAVLSAIAAAARQGVLFKGGVHLENLAEVKAVAFDKTGTLTYGELHLTDVVVGESQPEGFGENDVLAFAAAIESRSEHPIAQAILAESNARGIELPSMRKFINLTGRGAHAIVNDYLTWIGGERMYEEHGEEIPDDLVAAKERLEKEGKTVLVLHRELSRKGGVGEHEEHGGWLGLVAVADEIRREARDTIDALKRQNIEKTVMLTGDNATVAQTVAREAGVDTEHHSLMPEEKVTVLHRLQRDVGPVLMVGDGVNDAPALAHASVGLAMGAAGTDVAMESADLVLMGEDLRKIPFAIELSRRTARTVRVNVAFALAVIAFLVAGVFLFDLPLPLGVLGHEGSTIIVALNGLRLLAVRDAG